MSRARACCGSKSARNTPEVPSIATPTLSWPHLPTDWQEMLNSSTQDRGKFQRAVLTLLDINYRDGLLPTNGRFDFYGAEQRGWVAKKRYCSNCGAVAARTDAQNLNDATESLRDKGLVPYDWYTDETRDWSEYRYFDSVMEVAATPLFSTWLNPWVSHPQPLMMFEARASEGVMARYLAARNVAHTAFNGQSGKVMFANWVAPWLQEHPESEVLYVGDLDLSGEQIEDHGIEVLRTKAPSWTGDWTRLAITPDQAADLAAGGMSPVPKTDRRYVPPRRGLAWEAEALGQKYLRDLIVTELDARLPRPLRDVRRDETREATLMREYLDGYEAWRAGQ